MCDGNIEYKRLLRLTLGPRREVIIAVWYYDENERALKKKLLPRAVGNGVSR